MFQPTVECLETRIVPSRTRDEVAGRAPGNDGSGSPPDAYSLAFIASAALVRQLDADGTIDRVDVETITRSLGTISGIGLHDLRALPAFEDSVALKSITAEMAGAFFAGETTGEVETAIGHYLEGTDRPASGGVYAPIAGSLFINGPQYYDVMQGSAGDCWLLVKWAETALQQPQNLPQIEDGGGGVYFVSFNSTNWVTVDNWLPTYADGSLMYAKAPQGELWCPLLEKAYCISTHGSYVTGVIANGIGGDPATEHAGSGYAGQKELKAITDFQTGQIATFTTNALARSPVVNDHVYAMVGYDAATDTFALYNPWGLGTDHPAFPGVIYVTWAQLAPLGFN